MTPLPTDPEPDSTVQPVVERASVAGSIIELDRHIAAARQRSRRYWYEDGLAELVTGAVFLSVAGVLALQWFAAAGGWLKAVTGLALPAIVLLGALAARRLIGAAKAALVYPRTGYVSYAPTGQGLWRKWLTALAGFLMALMLVLLSRRAPVIETIVPAGEGLLIGAFYLWIGTQVRLTRFALVAVVTLAAGVALTLASVPLGLSAPIFFGVLGTAQLLAGALAFILYLRQAPPPEAA